MKTTAFRGGIHPPYKKSLTNGTETTFLDPGQFVYIPLSQHIGAACTGIVAPGDKVLVGQKIGDSEAFVSSPVHSSVSGTVKEIKKHLHPSGNMIETVIIENDFKYTEIKETKHNYRKIHAGKLLELIREAGIVGMGGAGFPAHIKLNPPKDKPIDCVIINGAECEPYLSSDHRAMLEQPDDLIRGLEIIMKVVGCKKGVIAIEDNKPDAIKILGERLDKKSIEIAVLKTKYPQGSEKHIIKSVLGRTVPSGKLPADVGAVVTNVDTAISIKNAVEKGMPVIRRRVTVSGLGIKNPGVYSIRMGTLFDEVITAAGGFNEDVIKVVSGGPMTGTQIFNTEIPVIKTTSGILALSSKETSVYQESPCLRCGKCVTACPMGLIPLDISAAGRIDDAEKALKLNAADCIECGCCSYVCPSRRNLLESIRLAKNKVQALYTNRK